MMQYMEALALTRGLEIKGKIWQTLLLIWATMLVCGMAKVQPPLLPFFFYQSIVLSAIILIDYHTDKPQKEVVLVWFLMMVATINELRV